MISFIKQHRTACIWVWCAGVAVFHIYASLSGAVREPHLGAVHFGLFMISLALLLPDRSLVQRWGDALAALIGALGVSYIIFQIDALYARGVQLNAMDMTAALMVVAAALWGGMRAAGPIIPVLALAGLAYMGGAAAGFSGQFSFPGLSFDTVLFRTAFETTGLFGSIATLSAGTVFPFVIFGALLVRAGAAESAIVLASRVTGKMVGGPALAAVVGSALTGTMTGSAVANAATTGAVTIPSMKERGFTPAFAAGVEAAASTGGQIMPPVMGAGAFVMIALTGLSFNTIVLASVLPAILYFLSVAFAVRVEARKRGLAEPLGITPTGGALTLGRILSFVVPFTALAVLLAIGYTPSFAAMIGMGLVVAMSWFTPHKLTPAEILAALEGAVRTMAPLAALLVCVGLITLAVTATGLGPTFSLMLTEWSGGNLYLMLVLVALASLVLGLGLPVTAAYIVLATVAAPALHAMIADAALVQGILDGTIADAAKPLLALSGIEGTTAGEIKAAMAASDPALLSIIRETALDPVVVAGTLLAAHLTIFWLSQDSNVTPPVALAAFTAASIAGASPMRAGLAAWRLAKGLYFLPVLMVTTPLVMGSWPAAVWAAILAVPALYALTIGISGHGQRRLPLWQRPLLLVLGGVLLLNLAPWANLLCGAAVAYHFAWEKGAIGRVSHWLQGQYTKP